MTLTPSTIQTVSAPLEGRRVVASHVSIPIIQDLTLTNKISQNLHAELTLRALGRILAPPSTQPNQAGDEGSFAQGARVVRQFLKNAGVSPDDFFFNDGSGLSTSDLIAPRAYTTLLTYAAGQSWGEAWKSTFPIAGVDGSLSGRFKDSPLKGQALRQNRHLKRSHRSLRLPDRGQRQDGGIFHPGERPSAWQ